MKSSYKLADGSLSTDYKVGDEFEVVLNGGSFFIVGDIVSLINNDGSQIPEFRLIKDGRSGGDDCCSWGRLKPHRKQFTKADLKDGMIVTYREGGHERLVFDGNLFELTSGRFIYATSLDRYEDSLLRATGSDDDIIKASYMNEVIWEREEETAEQKEVKRLRDIIEDAQKALSALERNK